MFHWVKSHLCCTATAVFLLPAVLCHKLGVLKTKLNNNKTPPHHFASKTRENFGHCCIPDILLPFFFKVYILQHSEFFNPSGKLNCNELLEVFAPLFACLNRKHWIFSHLFWLSDHVVTPATRSLWKGTWARTHQAARSARSRRLYEYKSNTVSSSAFKIQTCTRVLHLRDKFSPTPFCWGYKCPF